MSTKTYIILFILAAIVGLALAAAGKGTSQIINEATRNPIEPMPERYYVLLPNGHSSDCLSKSEARRLHARKGGTLLYCK